MNLKSLLKLLLIGSVVFVNPVQAQSLFGQSPWSVAHGIMGEEAVLQHRLVADHTEVTTGQPIQLAWEFAMQPGWHIYWQNAGDSGLPPMLQPILPDGSKGPELPLTFPAPEVVRIPPITNYGFHGRVLLGTTYTVPSHLTDGPLLLPFQADYLYCKDVCLPGSVSISLPLIIAQQAIKNPRFKAAVSPKNWSAEPLAANLAGDNFILTLPQKTQTAQFIPATEGLIEDSAAQILEGNTLALKRDTTAAIPQTLDGILTLDGKSYSISFPLQTILTPPHTAGASFWLMAFYALLAGLILNLMPCVLPVLSLKLFSLVRHQADPGRVRHALAYTGGVVASFWGFALLIMALKAGGASLGWGFHLQQPMVVAALALLMVAIALNFWGVFSIGEGLTRLGGKPKRADEESLWGSIATGALAVVVATPCTVPFMGAAVGYALLENNTLQTLSIFTALGLGMALPFLLVIAYPMSLKWLPKPGAWMLTFKHLLGWPMLLTGLWLVYVYQSLTSQVPTFTLLFGAILLAFTLWLYGRCAKWPQLALVWLAFILTLGGLHTLNKPQAEPWQPWSTAQVADAQANGHPIFIDFTADWCLTCKVTEATVLNTASVQELFKLHNVVLLKADWTTRDDAITAELARYGRQGVPLYLLYLPGNPEPKILPQLLNYSLLAAEFATTKAP